MLSGWTDTAGSAPLRVATPLSLAVSAGRDQFALANDPPAGNSRTAYLMTR